MSFPRRRESRAREQTGFQLEFIPMAIGAGMTEKIAPKEPPLPDEIPDEVQELFWEFFKNILHP